MKTKKTIVATAIGLAAFVDTQAAQVYTPAFYDISRIGSYSTLFPPDSTLQGFTRVFFAQPLVWTAGTCEAGSVLIRAEDKTLLASAQIAFASGRTVQVFAEDSFPKPYGLCVLTYIQYQ